MVAQLVEHLTLESCLGLVQQKEKQLAMKAEVMGSSPIHSLLFREVAQW